MNCSPFDLDQVKQHIYVTTNRALTSEQISQRKKQFGYNVVEGEKPISRWLLLLKQFQDFLIVVLLAATLIAGMLGEYIDAIAIMVIVLVNGFIGFFQEQKAEKSLEKLKEL